MNITKRIVNSLRNLFVKKVPAAIERTFDAGKFNAQTREANAKLTKKLAQRIGPGVRDHHRSIRKKRIASVKRLKRKRWINGRITPLAPCQYHTEAAANRAVNRLRQYGRLAKYDLTKTPPRWMVRNAQMAVEQINKAG